LGKSKCRKEGTENQRKGTFSIWAKEMLATEKEENGNSEYFQGGKSICKIKNESFHPLWCSYMAEARKHSTLEEAQSSK